MNDTVWAVAAFFQMNGENYLKSMFIQADNRYEALGKCFDIVHKLWPQSVNVTASALQWRGDRLVVNPDNATIEP
jgi:hypothetical protein